MTIQRVATGSQQQALLQQITRANVALVQSQTQVSSGKVSSTYGGYGDKTAVLEAARAAAARADAYQQTTKLALDQVDLQNTQLTALSDIAQQLRDAVTKASGTGDGSTLMTDVNSLFEQAVQILNSRDANGNYIYGGEKDNVPPVTANSISDLLALPDAASAFQNGTQTRSVATGDGQTIKTGALASDIGSQLLQAMRDVAAFDQTEAFGTNLSGTQSDFLTGMIQSTTDAATTVNNATAVNGYAYSRLEDAASQQQSYSTLYKGFVSDLEDVDMGEAVMRLNQNQVALQAALQVSSRLNQLSLLNFLGN